MQLMTPEEAAAQLRLKSSRNLARFARRHGLPLIRLGQRVIRVRVEDLEQFLESRRAASTTAQARHPK